MRTAALILLALVALAVPALAASGTGLARPQMLAPHVPGMAATSGGPTAADNLTYGGPLQSPAGSVMPSVVNYAIYWVPSGFSVGSNYTSVIDGFFQNLAAASGSPSNVYAPSTQYADAGGQHFDGTIGWGGSLVDTHSYPASGCSDPASVVGTTVCLTDAQLQAEIARVAGAQSWPTGTTVEFFVYTPKNVGSCYDATTCAYDTYCAYHGEFSAGGNTYVYANMPWPNQPYSAGGITYSSVCDSGQHPNGSESGGTPTSLDAADEVINVTSHEANESITDPDGFEWWVDQPGSPYAYDENGDLCAWHFGSALGSTATGQYNQVIGSGKYYVQGEWSNADATATAWSGCVWKYTANAPVNVSAPTVLGNPAVGVVVTASTGSWTGAASYAYQWELCDSGGAACSPIAAATAKTYAVQPGDLGSDLRVQVTATNTKGSSTAESDAVGPVELATPANTTPPSITGTPVAQTGSVSAANGTWTHQPTSFTYQWKRCDAAGTSCSAIAGATAPGYRPTLADNGSYLGLDVTAHNAYGSTTASAVPVGPVTVPWPVVASPPAIAGTAAVGKLLVAHLGTWAPVARRYQVWWLRSNGTGWSIVRSDTVYPGTGSSLTLHYADRGHRFRLKVYAINGAGVSAAVYSAPTDPVA